MKKNPKIKISLILILVFAFSIIFFSSIETKAFEPEIQTEQTQLVEQTTPVQKEFEQPKSIPEKNIYAIKHIEKKGFKYTVIKFFMAMFGVLLSSLAVFLGLKLYKKYALKTNLDLDKTDYNKTLESPKTFKDAINIFLDKTDK